MISKMKYDNAVEKYLVHHFNVTFKKNIQQITV